MNTTQASESVDELIMARSMALGKALAENGSEPRVRQAQSSLIKRAYPEILEVPENGEAV